jgi:hypothetical protein
MRDLTTPFARILIICVLSLSNAAQVANKFPYKISEMPFNATALERRIDKRCGASGSAKIKAQRTQNQAKNNFGVSGTPVKVTFDDFDALEKASAVAKNCWKKNLNGCKKLAFERPVRNSKRKSPLLPNNREQLKDLVTTADGGSIGEGTIVSLTANVYDSHYSNLAKGESVDCNSKGVLGNDIHIVLLESLDSPKECESVTAEISPHFRPQTWMHFHNMENEPSKIKGIDFSEFQAVRITGPLFYDASHSPCRNGQGGPKRRSIWEIHPVYKLEVKINNQWRNFEDWAKAQDLDQ